MSIITVYSEEKEISFSSVSGTDLLEMLRNNGINIAAACGGKGTCGKCRVLLSDEDGTRIVSACRTYPEKDCRVTIPSEEGDLSWNESGLSGPSEAVKEQGRTGLGAAVDLGTTTVAAALYDLSDGRELAAESRWNAQKSYGGDVISRIAFCMENEDGLMIQSRLIRDQIYDMLKALCSRTGRSISDVREIFLAGNTVMQHIFAGISPDSIAAAPFVPETYFDDGKPVMLENIPVFLSPCSAGYVGGDITAGILSTGISGKKGKSLFIDVGTNGEMVLGDEEGLSCCAVACGPAFEGAGISCGMPAGYGAVNKVELTEDGLSYDVLGGKEAEGLCGSGLLDLTACLLELGYIDEYGCLSENEDGEAVFWLTDKVFINQKDIRQLQLAKAAVAAGIKLLMAEESLSCEDIDKLYLAGGFGNRLRPESAAAIGMIPAGMLEKIKTAGNTSLKGAASALTDLSLRKELNVIKAKCRYIELSSHKDFNDCFVNEMSFRG